MDFVIGGIAGVAATVITNPMDVIKTRLQLQGELTAKAETNKRYRGIFHALYVIGKTDGVTSLQRGLVPALCLGFTMNSVRLGLFHVSESRGWIKNKDNHVSFHKSAVSAFVAGAASGVVGNPFFVVKTRIQAAAHPSIAVGRQHVYKGTLDAFLTIYKTEGVRGFLAGINATCTRLAIGSVAQLTTFSATKNWLSSRGGYLESSQAVLALSASLVSGVIVVLVETPLDVVNTRLFNQGPSHSKSGPRYKGVVDCLTKIVKIEGFTGLYKGVWPLYLRIAPHTTLSLVIWDLLNKYIEES